MPSVVVFPSTQTSHFDYLRILQKVHSPSMTTLKLLSSPWTTSSVCATVYRASSCVSLSNLCRTASISLSPINLLANFSAQQSNREYLIATSHLLNRPCLISFVASASTESTSAIILTMMSDIVGGKDIFSVYIWKRLRKFSTHSKRSASAS